MPASFTTVSASHLQDATGTPINNATISFLPVANNGVPLSFRAGGAEGQVVSQAVSTTVSNGAFSIQLADTSLTTPVNVGYRVTVTDNVSGKVLLGSGYGCFQPTGDSFDFDTYEPNLAGQITVQTGPSGQSAYQAWLSLGNTGTVAQFIASLIGQPGSVNLAQLSATKQYINVLDLTTLTPGMWINAGDGSVNPYGGLNVSASIPMPAGQQWVTNFDNPVFAGVGWAYYNAAGVYLSGKGGDADHPAGEIQTAPSNSATMRISVYDASKNAPVPQMVIYGTTMPSSYVAPGIPATDIVTVDSIAAASNTSLAGYSLSAVAALSEQAVNIFDSSRAINTGVIQGGALVTGYGGYWCSDFIPCAGYGTVTANVDLLGNGAGYGTAFYDINKNHLAGLDIFVTQTANTPVAIPAAAYYFRFSNNTVPLATGNCYIVRGSAPPVGYRAFGSLSLDQMAATFRAIGGQGKRVAFFYDSYIGLWGGAWIPEFCVKTGLVNTVTDAKGGITMSQIFRNLTNTNGPGTGTYTVGAETPNSGSVLVGVTTGQTLAQVLANADVAIIGLSTNDVGASTPIGSLGDSTTTPSLYGYTSAAITGILTAAPGIRLMGVGSVWTTEGAGTYAGVQAVDNCLATQYAAYGIPYLSMLKKSGVNPLTRDALTQDGIHLTTAAYGGLYAGTLANFVANRI